MKTLTPQRLALVGGTGKEGRGLAARLVAAGHEVVIGSRDAARAAACAEAIGAARGGENANVVKGADCVFLCVPYAAHAETLRSIVLSLSGQVLIDLTVPLVPPTVRTVHLPIGRSAAEEGAAIVGASARVVAALHHVSSVHLGQFDAKIDCDVLCCGDDEAAVDLAMALIGDLGLRALHAGPLQNAVALEALTPVLLHLNKRYRSAGAGLRFTGL